ncbi:MAG: hypothetical protein FJW37_06905 [Acidobacteria bacterium]|nr:hypothetical protein [Acidobacteriota bacterium]
MNAPMPLRPFAILLFGFLLASAWQEAPQFSARVEVSTAGRLPARTYLFKSGQPFRLQPVHASMPVRSDLFYRDRLWLETPDPDVLEIIANDEYHYLLLKGQATFHLPPGKYRMEAYRGLFYTPASAEFELQANETRRVELALKPWDGVRPEEWVSADDHIHITRTKREDPVFLGWLDAEDLNVGNFLQLQRQADAGVQYAFGREGEFRARGYAIRPGQETRNESLGHVLFLGGDKLIRPVSTGRDLANTPEDYPFHGLLFDLARKANALTGYAHFRERPHDSTLYMDLALGKFQFVELFQFGVLTVEPWYELLNAGFRIYGLAGSDFPANLPRLKPYPRWIPLLGPERAVVKGAHRGDPWSAWAEGVRKGNLIVTNGPVVDVHREGNRIEAEAAFWRPLETLEIIRNGQLVARAEGAGRTRLKLAAETRPGERAWYAARVRARKQESEPDLQAHTNPLYIGEPAVDPGARRIIADAWEDEIGRYRRRGLVFGRPEQQQEFFDLAERALAELRRPLQ